MLLLNTQKSNNGRKCSWKSLKKMKVDRQEHLERKVLERELLERKVLERELLQKPKPKLNNDESEN